MKISAVTAFPLSVTFAEYFHGVQNVPEEYLKPAAHFQVIPRKGQCSTIVEIKCDNGLIGYGEAWGLPDPICSSRYIDEIFSPALVGENPMEITKLWETLYSAMAGLGYTRGPAMEAISGIDQALWDIKGKFCHVPVYELLGGKFRDQVECYGSPVMMYPSPQQSAERAKELVKKGFGAIKLKAGRGIQTDLEHLAAVREAVGKNVKIMIDMNCGYSGKLREAVEFALEAESYRIVWFEEPVSCENLEDAKWIRHKIHTPIAMGENLFSPYDFKSLILSGAADIIMPNCGRVGGITGLNRIYHMAREFSIQISPHGVGSAVNILSTLQAMASWSTASLFEYNQLVNPLRDSILINGLSFQNGYISVPDFPGIGADVMQECLMKYLVKE